MLSENKGSEKSVKCDLCEKTFLNTKGLKLHKTRIHKGKGEISCGVCGNLYNGETQLENHIEMKNSDTLSPKTKKLKKDEEMDCTDEFLVENNDIDDNLFTLEEKSWEEMRLIHRNIEIKVCEDELERMQDFDEKDREN